MLNPEGFYLEGATDVVEANLEDEAGVEAGVEAEVEAVLEVPSGTRLEGLSAQLLELVDLHLLDLDWLITLVQMTKLQRIIIDRLFEVEKMLGKWP